MTATLDPPRLLELEDAMLRTFERTCADMRELFRFIVPFDRAQGWEVDGATSMAEWLCFRFSILLRSAREWVRAAHALEKLPAVADGFDRGLISWDKLQWLVQIATPQTDERLARLAVEANVAQVEAFVRHAQRIDRDRSDELQRKRGLWSRWDADEGMLRFWGRLHGAEGAVVQKAIDRVSEQLYPKEASAGVFRDRAELNADALVEIASNHLGADADVDRATVMCHVDAQVLASRDGNGALEYGVAVGADTVRRMACDGRMQMVFWSADGRVPGVGRATRTVPGWLGRLLQQRDHGCRWEGCGRTRGVQAHHIRHWADGGSTDADNLVSLCRFHHRLVHEGGWDLEVTPDGALLIRRPDTSLLTSRPMPLEAATPGRLLDGVCRGP